MKKGILTTAIAMFMAISSVFATTAHPIPQQIINKWQQDFANAGASTWRTVDKYYKATFEVNDQLMEAFYDSKGKLAGVSRYISVDQLPLALSKEVNDKGAKYEVSEIFELLTDKGTQYFVTYNFNSKKMVYESNGNSWSRFTPKTDSSVF